MNGDNSYNHLVFTISFFFLALVFMELISSCCLLQGKEKHVVAFGPQTWCSNKEEERQKRNILRKFERIKQCTILRLSNAPKI